MNRIIGGGMMGPPYWKGLKWMGAEQLDRIVRSEIIHELIGIWGNPGIGERYIKSEIIHSIPAKTPTSTLGEWPSDNIASDTVEVSLEHTLS